MGVNTTAGGPMTAVDDQGLGVGARVLVVFRREIHSNRTPKKQSNMGNPVFVGIFEETPPYSINSPGGQMTVFQRKKRTDRK